MGLCNIIIFYYISNKMQRYTVYFIWKLLYIFRLVTPPISRSANNCIYSVWYLSHGYCYLPLLWKGWNWFDCAAGGVCLTLRLLDAVSVQQPFTYAKPEAASAVLGS